MGRLYDFLWVVTWRVRVLLPVSHAPPLPLDLLSCFFRFCLNLRWFWFLYRWWLPLGLVSRATPFPLSRASSPPTLRRAARASLGSFRSHSLAPCRAALHTPASRHAPATPLWFIIAAHSGVAGSWQLAGVCRAARHGAKEWLRKLPR
jgi:hypothetical protein